MIKQNFLKGANSKGLYLIKTNILKEELK